MIPSPSGETSPKKYVETGACYDPYRQKDVDEYNMRVAKMSSEARAKGEDAWLRWRRTMVRNDLYYLLVFEAGYDFMVYGETEDEVVYRPFLFNRCREVQESPDYHVDIWARGHFKSTIITIGKTVQDILNYPEIAIAIFSYSSPSAEAFVSQVRNILERPNIRELFPEIIPENTSRGRYIRRDSQGRETEVRFTWTKSEFTVKREGSRKEPTLSGWGLIGSMPTGKHFDLLIYDDVVTPLSIVTQSQNIKTYQRFQDSLNTGSGEGTRIRIIGTFYSNRDTYYYILHPGESPDGSSSGNPDMESRYSLRLYPCRDEEGGPVLYTDRYLRDKEMMMVGYVYATQMMCNPQHGDGFRFLEEWIPERISREELLKHKNRYNFHILVDPAYTQKESSDFTTMLVVATTSTRQYIFADLIRDKITLSQKVSSLFELLNTWRNDRGYPKVFYEANSTASDYAVILKEKKAQRLSFQFISVSTKPKINVGNAVLGKPLKHNRILALEPLYREGRIIWVDHAVHRNWKGVMEDMMASALLELINYPYHDHDDFMDVSARIADLETGPQMVFPSATKEEADERRRNFKVVHPKDIFTVPKSAPRPF